MIQIAHLLRIADAYKAAAGVDSDSTVSSRVFNDGKRLGILREGRGDITVGRFNAALDWFVAHWPEGAAMPPELAVLRPDAAAERGAA